MIAGASTRSIRPMASSLVTTSLPGRVRAHLGSNDGWLAKAARAFLRTPNGIKTRSVRVSVDRVKWLVDRAAQKHITPSNLEHVCRLGKSQPRAGAISIAHAA